MRNYVSMHSNKNEQVLVLIRNTLRIIQLNYKLNVVFWNKLHPIFISCMGICQNITALIKIWLKKRHNKFSGRAIQVKDYLRYQAKFEEYRRLKQLSTKLVPLFGQSISPPKEAFDFQKNQHITIIRVLLFLLQKQDDKNVMHKFTAKT